MCLSVILLFNKCHYWLVWKVKENGRCKISIYCKREMNLSWKRLLITLNKNDLIIKIFLELCLVIIYDEYMYMCIHMCIMKCIHIFMFSLLFLGLKMTTSFFLSPILRFNKAYWFYLKLNPMQGNCTVQDWVISQSPEWVYRLIYVCTYVFLRETTSSYNRLFLCFRMEMNL